jgi:Trypsin-co-occurring domain 2
MKKSKLCLSDAIDSIRSEIVKAQLEAKAKDFKFELGEIELELEIAAEVSSNAGFKANWWVVTGEVGEQHKEVSKHKLKIKLKTAGEKAVEVTATSDQEPKRP